MAANAMTSAMASLSLTGSALPSTSSRVSATPQTTLRSSFLSAKWQPKAAPLSVAARARAQPVVATSSLLVQPVMAAAAASAVVMEPEAGGRYPPFAAFKIHGTGRRKTAVARVGLIEGTGKIFVNKLPLADYFQGQALMIQAVKSPMSSLGYEGKYDLVIKAHGGGLNAQAQAMVMGIARALCEANIANRPPLKAQGMLTRDARKVERKKYGLHKARKAPQFSKR